MFTVILMLFFLFFFSKTLISFLGLFLLFVFFFFKNILIYLTCFLLESFYSILLPFLYIKKTVSFFYIKSFEIACNHFNCFKYNVIKYNCSKLWIIFFCSYMRNGKLKLKKQKYWDNILKHLVWLVNYIHEPRRKIVSGLKIKL